MSSKRQVILTSNLLVYQSAAFPRPPSKQSSEKEHDLDRHHNEIGQEELDGYMEVLEKRLERERLRERVRKFMICAIVEDKIGPHLREES